MALGFSWEEDGGGEEAEGAVSLWMPSTVRPRSSSEEKQGGPLGPGPLSSDTSLLNQFNLALGGQQVVVMVDEKLQVAVSPINSVKH